ncbi:hypothetical protein [Sinomonas gamaensis]|uniref:hypothetical protein n=1 Tax=Sinomonas gamaensis TaxID=2565624 RepID=UPI001109D518|nr:hypothetical protein [Sinomonas gamaensis]
MGQRILVRSSDGSWQEPSAEAYLLEQELQDLLLEHPQLVPGVGDGSAACRELQLDPGPADLVVLGSDAAIAIVECKLARNPQVRREIVGQLFDYASALWRMQVGRFDELWARRVGRSAIADFESQTPGYRQALQQTLDAGSFRLVIAVDAINPALQRMMEYLNSISGNASVIAVEYSRLRHGSVELLLPTVYGEELATAKESIRASVDGRERKLWTSDVIRSDLEARDAGSVPVFDAFVRTIAKSGLEFEGKSALDPAGGVIIKDPEVGKVGELTVIFYPPATTKLELNFIPSAKFRDDSVTTRVAGLLERISLLPSFTGAIAEIQQKGIGHRRPNLFLNDLTPDDVASLVTLVAQFNGN